MWLGNQEVRPGSVSVALGRSLDFLSVSFPFFPIEPMASLSGWGEDGGDKRFPFGVGQWEENWCGTQGSGLSPLSTWPSWVIPDTSSGPQFPTHTEGAWLPSLPWASAHGQWELQER